MPELYVLKSQGGGRPLSALGGNQRPHLRIPSNEADDDHPLMGGEQQESEALFETMMNGEPIIGMYQSHPLFDPQLLQHGERRMTQQMPISSSNQ